MQKISYFLCCALIASSFSAYAATLPDSGALLRQQQQSPQLPESLPTQEESEVAPPTAKNGTKITVHGFRFVGIEGMATEAEMQELLKNAVGKEQGLADFQRLTNLVTNYLRDQGFFLARAYLPEQEVTAGIVEIVVLGGRVDGAATVRAQKPLRIRDSILREMTDNSVPSGEALNYTQLEQTLMLLNDLPGITAHGTLERGETYDSTKVLLDIAEGPLVSGSISGDNFGSRYTGVWQASGSLNINDPFGIGDQFSLFLTGSEGLVEGRAAFTSQLHSSGLKGGVSYTGLDYDLGKELKPLDLNGRANTVGANLSYPVLRARSFSLWLNLDYEYRMLDDYYGNTRIRDRDIHAGTFGLSTSGYDNFGGGGFTSIRLAVTDGNLKLSEPLDSAADAATAKSAGNYDKFTYSVARLQRLIGNLSLLASASGQLTGSNLDSSEKFILGGPHGVRAYPVGEASGDEGHRFTTELHYDVPIKTSLGNLKLVGFMDAGNITLHKNEWSNSIDTATDENNYWLYGGGFGANLGKPGLYTIRALWAHTVGDNPGRSVAGNNADNKDDSNRFWIQATIWF